MEMKMLSSVYILMVLLGWLKKMLYAIHIHKSLCLSLTYFLHIVLKKSLSGLQATRNDVMLSEKLPK